MLDLWYKNAVVYCLDVDAFMDSDGNGVGDFHGLADRLDHLEDLGVTCLWLLPFSPSPDRDNGYDIIDFYNVDPRLGTPGDFVDFTHAAQDRGMRVIIDLVANHTSIDHPWFQSARSDPDSPYRDWYVWSKDKPEDMHEGLVFPGVQEATWTYDEAAEAWYFHRFYKHQPDLNVANPAVREEIERIMGFWLQLGVSGFRVDAVPFLIEYRGVEPPQERSDPHVFLNEIRQFLSWRKAEAILLGEANIPLDQALDYFGDGDRMHVVFNFILNQQLFLALARGSAEPVRQVLADMPPLPPTAQWANFLRNHDELDLGRLTGSERQEVFQAFGPEPEMQLYGRGLRRRLAPMLGGDQARLKMAYSLMFALPGTPVLWYGEEIGMGENLSLTERMAVRTPMQWRDAPHGGFSAAAPEDLVRPVLRDGEHGYKRANVESQRDAAGSLMDSIQRLVRTRRACPEIGWGECTVLESGHPAVLALSCRWRGGEVVTVHNFGNRPVRLRLGSVDPEATLRPLMASVAARAARRANEPIALDGYAYAWFRVDGVRR
jgi:maltose alpha-D-glucosyltransferase/alpha-amylase